MSLATRIAQEFNNVRSHISGITATHLLGGNLSVSNEVITNGFSTTLYTGNGGTQSINTGIDMATQHGDDASEMFGGLYWGKSRSIAAGYLLADSINGATKYLQTNTTAALATDASTITAFTSTGVSLGSNSTLNTNGTTYVSWNFQTTHRSTGITNHGKAFTEHYNPFTGFTIVKYEGSGIAGHEIPHSLGRKLGFWLNKNLTIVAAWNAQYRENYNLSMDIPAEGASAIFGTNNSETSLTLGTGVLVNASGNQHIMYGWANSYYYETNKLIGNYEVGVYQGTGGAGNKVVTRGKPAWVMIKRLDAIGNWNIYNNQVTDGRLIANLSNAESTYDATDFVSDGFILKTGVDTEHNVSGGKYLYMVVYDNDSGSGKSKYTKTTDTSNVQINNAIIPLAHGIDSNGSKNSIVIANETITGLTYTQGKNYLYKTDTGYGVKPYEPRYFSSELVRRYAGEQPDYYDIESNKWFNTDVGSDLVSNGTFSSGVTTGWTAVNATLSVVNGTLRVSNSTTSAGYAYQALPTIVGKKYRLLVSGILGTSVNFNFKLGISINSADYYSKAYTASSSDYVEFVAQSTTTYITLYNNSAVSGQYTQWDGITAFLTDITQTTEITESRNYLNHIVHAYQNGQVTYVEELPKIEYKNIIKANEFRGRNANSLSVAFDLTTTPINIKGELIGCLGIVRTGTGIADIYIDSSIDVTKLKLNGITNGNQIRVVSITSSKITIETSDSSGTATSYTYTSINGVG